MVREGYGKGGRAGASKAGVAVRTAQLKRSLRFSTGAWGWLLEEVTTLKKAPGHKTESSFENY